MGGRISRDISTFYFTKVVKSSHNGKESLSKWKFDPMELLEPLTDERIDILEKEKHVPLELFYDRDDKDRRKRIRGCTPLHLASELRNVQLLEDMVKAIFDAKRINTFEDGNKGDDVHAVGTEIDWNIRNDNGYSPLSVAVENESVDAVQLLIDVGADPHEPFCTNGNESDERWAWSYLRYAAWNGKLRSLNALLTVKDISRRWDRDGKRAIHLAVENNQLEAVKILLDHDLKRYFNEKNTIHPSYYETARTLAVELFIVRAPEPYTKNLTDSRPTAYSLERQTGNQQSSSAPLELLELLRGALRIDNPPDMEFHNPTQQAVPSITSRNTFSSKDRGSTLLHLAAACGNRKILEFFLSHPAFSQNLLALNEFGKSPIFMAVRHGHLSCIHALHEAGVSLSSADIENWSIMHEAVKYQHNDIINFLIDSGCDVNFSDDDGWTPLHVAARFCVTKAIGPLMSAGADIDAVTDENETVLQIAVAQKNNDELLSEILRYEPEYASFFGSVLSPERTLIERRDFSMLRIFLNHVNESSRNNTLIRNNIKKALKENPSILHRCVSENDLETTEILLEMGADASTRNAGGETVLFYVARKGNVQLAQTLLNSKCNPDMCNRDGTRAIHVASDSGQDEILNSLLQHGCDPESRVPSSAPNGGFTPLMLAARRGHDNCIGILKKFGVQIDVQKEDGYTALHLTALNGHVNALRALINAGADTEIKEQNGFVPLHVAVRNQQFDATSALLAGGANPQATGPSKLSALHFAAHVCDSRSVWLLIQCGVSVTATDDHDATPLHYCCRQQRGQSCVQLLLTCNSYINAKDMDGDTPLHCACQSGIVQSVRILLKRGADPNISNKLGTSPLHSAVSKRSESIVSVLLKYGADGMAPDENGESPFQLAVKTDNKEAKLLIWRSLGFTIDDVAPETIYNPKLSNEIDENADITEEDNICVICQTSFQPKERIRILPCMHQYKSSCIEGWFGSIDCKDHDYCPLCQNSIIPNVLPARNGTDGTDTWMSKREREGSRPDVVLGFAVEYHIRF